MCSLERLERQGVEDTECADFAVAPPVLRPNCEVGVSLAEANCVVNRNVPVLTSESAGIAELEYVLHTGRHYFPPHTRLPSALCADPAFNGFPLSRLSAVGLTSLHNNAHRQQRVHCQVTEAPN